MIEKTITIGNMECSLRSSAALPRMYRAKFKRDIFKDLTQLTNDFEKAKKNNDDMPITSLELFENVAYLMHKAGDPTQPNNIDDWLDQFEAFDIYQVLPEILELWNLNTDQMSKAKKKNVPQIGK